MPLSPPGTLCLRRWLREVAHQRFCDGAPTQGLAGYPSCSLLFSSLPALLSSCSCSALLCSALLCSALLSSPLLCSQRQRSRPCRDAVWVVHHASIIRLTYLPTYLLTHLLTVWVVHHASIVRHYLRSWFANWRGARTACALTCAHCICMGGRTGGVRLPKWCARILLEGLHLT